MAEVITGNSPLGKISVADDVIAAIAGLAATEVEGVNSLAGDISNELVERLGVKALSKGVKIEVNGREVKTEISIIINSNAALMEVSNTVQEKVKTAIESMTGLNCVSVDVKVAGVRIA